MKNIQVFKYQDIDFSNYKNYTFVMFDNIWKIQQVNIDQGYCPMSRKIEEIDFIMFKNVYWFLKISRPAFRNYFNNGLIKGYKGENYGQLEKFLYD